MLRILIGVFLGIVLSEWIESVVPDIKKIKIHIPTPEILKSAAKAEVE